MSSPVRHNPGRRRAGTSLIEVLVVIVVFMVGILAIAQIFPGGFKILAKTRDEYDKLKGAVIYFSGESEADARRKRAAFVDEHGADAYFNRNSGSTAA